MRLHGFRDSFGAVGLNVARLDQPRAACGGCVPGDRVRSFARVRIVLTRVRWFQRDPVGQVDRGRGPQRRCDYVYNRCVLRCSFRCSWSFKKSNVLTSSSRPRSGRSLRCNRALHVAICGVGANDVRRFARVHTRRAWHGVLRHDAATCKRLDVKALVDGRPTGRAVRRRGTRRMPAQPASCGGTPPLPYTAPRGLP